LFSWQDSKHKLLNLSRKYPLLIVFPIKFIYLCAHSWCNKSIGQSTSLTRSTKVWIRLW